MIVIVQTVANLEGNFAYHDTHVPVRQINAPNAQNIAPVEADADENSNLSLLDVSKNCDCLELLKLFSGGKIKNLSAAANVPNYSHFRPT